jgi:hypothetical protein
LKVRIPLPTCCPTNKQPLLDFKELKEALESVGAKQQGAKGTLEEFWEAWGILFFTKDLTCQSLY